MNIEKFMEILRKAVYFDITAECMELDLTAISAKEEDCPALYQGMKHFQKMASVAYAEAESMIPKVDNVTTPEELVALVMLKEAVMIRVSDDTDISARAYVVEGMFEDIDDCIADSDYPEDFDRIKEIVAEMIL